MTEKKTKVRVASFSISLDGYGAAADQSLDNPMGIDGKAVHEWVFSTRWWSQIIGQEGGTEGIDNDFLKRGSENLGAWIIGRNMFGPVRGPWPDMNWKGWWGNNPPYHVPVYVLTHYARPPLEMEGGTTFYFITEGIHDALAKAREAANGKDIRIGGGASIIQQYLREGLIDELHIAITPTILGGGERLFDNVDLRKLGYECVRFEASENVTHVILQHNKKSL